MEDGLVNNRELAGIVWLTILAGFVVIRSDRARLGKSIKSLTSTVASRRVLMPMLAYVSWIGTGVWLAHQIGLWNTGLLKLTIIWALFSGLGLFFSFDKALRQDKFFKSALLGALGASALVEFYVSFQSFPLAIELLTQPIVLLAVTASALAGRDPEQRWIAKFAEVTLAAFGLVAIGWVTWTLITRWEDIDASQVIRELGMPGWLTVIALVFVYFLALYAGYGAAFARIGWKSSGRGTWRVKAAFVSAAGVRLGRLRRLNGIIQMRVAEETTFKGGRRAIAAAMQDHERLLRPNTEPASAPIDQVSWSISTEAGDVTLKGDLPDGYPTETWLDSQLLDRDLGGDFSWDLQSRVPLPISIILGITACDRLASEFIHWSNGADGAPTRDGAVRQLAYAQAARDRSRALGCLSAGSD